MSESATEQTSSTQPVDAQEFVQGVADNLRDQGYGAMATFLEQQMPDADVTSMGGGGAEAVTTAIVTEIIEQHGSELWQAATEALTSAVSAEVSENAERWAQP